VNQIPRERLEKTLARVAREHGLDQERLRRVKVADYVDRCLGRPGCL